MRTKLATALALALAITLSCTSDIELPPPPLDNSSSSSENTGETKYSYCITADNICLIGPFTASACNGQPSNNCPYGGNSSAGNSSSSGGVNPSLSSSSATGSNSSSSDGSSSSVNGNGSSSSIASSNSSSSGGSSSSVNGSSSSTIASVECPAYNPETHFCDIRDGKIYKWVNIGTQNWMAENLNYAVGGKCGSTLSGSGTVGDANTTTCDTYGRLYNWATAMAVCPSGWHLPSNAEWDALMTAVGGSSTAGKHLKATSGWNNYSSSSGNGTDDYGFSALPGGYGYSGGYFSGVGDSGSWWSSNEDSSSNAYRRYMYYYGEIAYYSSDDKYSLFSVRCVED